MLTAHLPAGYCLTKLMKERPPLALPTALFFSIVPDFDLIWFYWIDGRLFHHHRYWVHIPAFWAVVGTISLMLLWRTRYRTLAIIAIAAVFLHLILDSIAGGILWLYPWSNGLYHLVTVQPTGLHWLLTFTLHWTFMAELMIWALALVLYRKEVGARGHRSRPETCSMHEGGEVETLPGVLAVRPQHPDWDPGR